MFVAFKVNDKGIKLKKKKEGVHICDSDYRLKDSTGRDTIFTQVIISLVE